MENRSQKDRKWILLWLLIGVVMVFVQIMLGGITRLTGSGLSITRWEIVTGTLPPLNAVQWEEAFSLYRQTPQYQQINEGMEIGQFRFIYFWEYIHRLWARAMGFVFLIPFLFFLIRGSIHARLLRRLVWVVMLAGLAAIFGWIMVASGLKDRPWVDAYKLTIHLGLGIALFLLLFYIWLSEKGYKVQGMSRPMGRGIRWLVILTVIQICFGGFISGMKAALSYPTWPLMHGEWIPSILFDATHWNADNFLLYDKSGFMPALVQTIHRNLAYILVLFVGILAYRWRRGQDKRNWWVAYGLVGIIVVQVLLGILTLLGSKGGIPVLYGVLHQGMGIMFLTFLVYIQTRWKPEYI